ncbi:TonB-dependent receptor [Flavobacterium branchiophilum]|uniref:Vitamin B12 transporter n=1 Tax=Flavobacterium branchiophilum TaxID=55197 RepID=A0A543G6B8_9FLAO|nr:TonB-dependent receptor [Flavobacterium branchiophilum]OXA80250.1 TonB-dependent receptor [Flavobacterium branchiophilum] [Flavobacterium branchiophilum NBRC 15030 = ATCC 35035]TQM41607.1 vitamin B12 transporter [Flavobacterium branchiophilum]
MNKKKVQISVITALMSVCVWSQEKKIENTTTLDEVVVLDSKFALSKEKSGKVITKISSEALQNFAGQSVATVLNTVAGIEMNGNQSGNGKNLGYYIRGGKNNQVLILIDGQPVVDASGISMEFDLRLLSTEAVESIEIMKGSASTLYGSGAATGVIHITLKKTGNQKIQAKAYLNGGTNNTAWTKKSSPEDINAGFSLQGKYQKINYLAMINSTETKGISQIAEPEKGIVYESDRLSKLNYLGKINYKLNAALQVDFLGQFDKVTSYFDGTYNHSNTNDTDKNVSKSEQIRFGISPKWQYTKGALTLQTGFTTIKRDYQTYYSFLNDVSQDAYASKNVNVDAFNKYVFSKSFFLITGTQFQFNNMNYTSSYSNIMAENAKFNMADPYFSGVYNSIFGLNVNVGARLNHHSQYGNQWVYHINPSYTFKKTPIKLISSISTAFLTPSLYQLYSEYGNKNLTPERNKTVEMGFETTFLKNKGQVNLVGFYREQENFIGFYTNPVTYEGMYVNIDGNNKARGIETEWAYRFNHQWSCQANYTYIHVDEALNRLIPKHKVNVALDYQIQKRTHINLNYQYVDSKNDFYFDENYQKVDAVLASYQWVNGSIRYQLIKDRLDVFSNITNIFNEKFVENIGYNTRGRNFRFGLMIKL